LDWSVDLNCDPRAPPAFTQKIALSMDAIPPKRSQSATGRGPDTCHARPGRCHQGRRLSWMRSTRSPDRCLDPKAPSTTYSRHALGEKKRRPSEIGLVGHRYSWSRRTNIDEGRRVGRPQARVASKGAPLPELTHSDSEVPTGGTAGSLTEVDLPCRRSEWHGSFWPWAEVLQRL